MTKANIDHHLIPINFQDTLNDNDLINDWTYWIANEIADYLQNGKITNIEIEDALSVLDLDRDFGFNRLHELLDSKKVISEQQFHAGGLSNLKTSLENVYRNTISKEIDKISQDIKNEFVELLTKIVKVEFQQASSKNLMNFLKKLSSKLLIKKSELEEGNNYYLLRETAIFRAVYKLSYLAKTPLEYSQAIDGVFLGFESKIKAEQCFVISRAIFEIIQLCQSYFGHAKRTYVLLENIKNSLVEKSSQEPSSPIFTYLKKINIEEQKELLEVWMGGHDLNYIGTAPTSWQQVEAKLIENIRPKALSILNDFQLSFLPHIVHE